MKKVLLKGIAALILAFVSIPVNVFYRCELGVITDDNKKQVC